MVGVIKSINTHNNSLPRNSQPMTRWQQMSAQKMQIAGFSGVVGCMSWGSTGQRKDRDTC